MKKLLFTVFTFAFVSSNYFGQQCTVSLTADKQKICSDEMAKLTFATTDLKSVPDFSESKQIFDIKELKLDPLSVSIIKSGKANGLGYTFNETKGVFNMNLANTQLKNIVVTTGKVKISIQTDLKQDLKVVFELPNFKIKGLSLKDSIFITGNSSTSGLVNYEKEIDIANANVDFSNGNPSLYNTISYVVKPSFKISSNILTEAEIGNLKIDLKNLTFEENVTYEWYYGGNLIGDKKTPMIEVNKSGDYSVKTRSNCGQAESKITISVVDRPIKDVSLSGKLTFCDGDSVKLNALGKGLYLWSDNTTKTNIFKATKTGTYSVKITNDICSTQSDPVNVVVNPRPVLKLNKKDTTIIIGSQLTLKATGGKTYLWSNKSDKDSIVVKDKGTYTVTSTNEFGCSSSSSVVINVREKGVGLSTLNGLTLAVSPNPATEVLHISLEEYKNKSISIVDLKGNLVFTQALNSLDTDIKVDSFAKGIYLLNIHDGYNTILNTQRIVVE
jgi:hypothetical protein